MEGNREYYLSKELGDAFSWCSTDAWWRDEAGALFVHGDQINRKDRKYLYFRILARSQIVKFIVRYLPLGPKVVEFIKEELKKTNLEFRLGLPKEEIEFFAEARFAEGADTIFVGHFHQEYTYRNRESRELHILLDWHRTQKVTVYRRNPKKITFLHWREL